MFSNPDDVIDLAVDRSTLQIPATVAFRSSSPPPHHYSLKQSSKNREHESHHFRSNCGPEEALDQQLVDTFQLHTLQRRGASGVPLSCTRQGTVVA